MAKRIIGELVPGFPNLSNDGGTINLVKSTPSAKAKKSGGFQTMGLSLDILKGITKRGYKIPTPIQRKTIPLILEGRDVVAMAKTGSGKTACFLIPMFERLKRRDPSKGARAIILSPTRELAVQTYKFIKELGKFLDLKTILVLGGDSMDSQFSAIHTCPDVIIATAGRFLHLCIEMDLKLSSIEYIVFDEADRLFEMGFGEQLNEILNRLPSSRQMVMFSATLPKMLVDFAKAGLVDPILIRLDVETKLPETLTLKFIYCRPDDRYTSLIILLKYVIPTEAQSVVFAGTQHHVEMISYILNECGITNTTVYSNLDPTARKINTAKFLNRKASVLIVTDVAARGIDIPSLDYVINVHFPGKPKLFVHRVGRCARAGRTGTAFTIFSNDDTAHLLDLHLFLNRTLNINDNQVIGTIPQDLLEDEHTTIKGILNRPNAAGVLRTSENAYKRYLSSRPVASADSNARVKKIKFFSMKPLEDFITTTTTTTPATAATTTISTEKDNERDLLHSKHDFLLKMRNFKPSNTIFELNKKQKLTAAATTTTYAMMQDIRRKYTNTIDKHRLEMKQSDEMVVTNPTTDEDNDNKKAVNPEADEDDIKAAFHEVLASKKRLNMDILYKKKVKKPRLTGNKKTNTKDTENFIPYQSADKHTEDGLAIKSFERQAMSAEFSVVDRKITEDKPKLGMKKWDRKKKKMVAVQDPRIGKIRTESGAWIPASFKTGRYTQWKEKSKIEEQIAREMEEDHTTDHHNDEENDDRQTHKPLSHQQRYPVRRHDRHNLKVQEKKLAGSGSSWRGGRGGRGGRAGSGIDTELRNPEQIVKARLRLELIKKRNAENAIRKAENRKRSMRKYQRAALANAAKNNKNMKNMKNKGRKKR